MNLNGLAKEIHDWAILKSFYQRDQAGVYRHASGGFSGQCMLIITEMAEADFEHGSQDWEKFGIEIADTLIRLLDTCASIECDVEGHLGMLGRLPDNTSWAEIYVQFVNFICKAVECDRKSRAEETKKCMRYALASLLQLCNYYNINIEYQVEQKMKINREREKKHGRAY